MPLGDVIAEVFLRPGRTYSVMPTPGRRLCFVAGLAKVKTDVELDYCLNLPNASVRPVERYREHVALHIANRDELHPTKAEIDGGSFVCSASEYPRVLADYLQVGRVVDGPVVTTSAASLDAEPAEGFEPYTLGWVKEVTDEPEKPRRGRPRKE